MWPQKLSCWLLSGILPSRQNNLFGNKKNKNPTLKHFNCTSLLAYVYIWNIVLLSLLVTYKVAENCNRIKFGFFLILNSTSALSVPFLSSHNFLFKNWIQVTFVLIFCLIIMQLYNIPVHFCCWYLAVMIMCVLCVCFVLVVCDFFTLHKVILPAGRELCYTWVVAKCTINCNLSFRLFYLLLVVQSCLCPSEDCGRLCQSLKVCLDPSCTLSFSAVYLFNLCSCGREDVVVI